MGCKHVHPIIFAQQSKLVGIIHAYTLVSRSDPNTNSKLGFGCSVAHIRKGRPESGRTWWCSSRLRGRRRPGRRAAATAAQSVSTREREGQRARTLGVTEEPKKSRRVRWGKRKGRGVGAEGRRAMVGKNGIKDRNRIF